MLFNKSLRRIYLNYEIKTSGAIPQKSNPSSLYLRVSFFFTLWRKALVVAIKTNNPYEIIILNNLSDKPFLLETILKIFENSDE